MTYEERYVADRRAASSRAIARHFAECERRVTERRAALSHKLAAWQRRYDAARAAR